MSYTKLKVFMRMDTLLQKGATGTSNQFAKKMQVSRATLFRHMDEMKSEFKAPIEYCPKRKSYRYQKDFSLKLKDFLKSLSV